MKRARRLRQQAGPPGRPRAPSAVSTAGLPVTTQTGASAGRPADAATQKPTPTLDALRLPPNSRAPAKQAQMFQPQAMGAAGDGVPGLVRTLGGSAGQGPPAPGGTHPARKRDGAAAGLADPGPRQRPNPNPGAERPKSSGAAPPAVNGVSAHGHRQLVSAPAGSNGVHEAEEPVPGALSGGSGGKGSPAMGGATSQGPPRWDGGSGSGGAPSYKAGALARPPAANGVAGSVFPNPIQGNLSNGGGSGDGGSFRSLESGEILG